MLANRASRPIVSRPSVRVSDKPGSRLQLLDKLSTASTASTFDTSVSKEAAPPSNPARAAERKRRRRGKCTWCTWSTNPGGQDGIIRRAGQRDRPCSRHGAAVSIGRWQRSFSWWHGGSCLLSHAAWRASVSIPNAYATFQAPEPLEGLLLTREFVCVRR